MFAFYKSPAFFGDYFSVGYQHAEWWVNYLNQPGNEDYKRYYKSFLRRSWKDKFAPLLENTAAFSPQIIEEISGMHQALKDEGIKTSFENTFAVCLGETGDKGSQCTSFASICDDAIYLGHNEEENEVCPLCIAQVTIKGDKPKEFVAASYPFQLFGSAFGGFNKNIAFQGNSIGYFKNTKEIESSWAERMPKTIFTRIFLEADSLKDILLLCSEYLFSLPSHHYLIDRHKLYSLEIRPSSTFREYPLHQVTLKEITGQDFHTNHFVADGLCDDEWLWKFRSDQRESVKRLDLMRSKYIQETLKKYTDYKKVLSDVAKDKLCFWKSSSSFLVCRTKAGFSLSTINHFNKTKFKFDIYSD